jgi:hypothetical protein
VKELEQFGPFTKILIDGRARNWCAEEVRHYLAPKASVFIHDWTIRPVYHSVIEWYKIVGLKGSMCELKLK